MILFFMVPIVCSQPQSENVKQKTSTKKKKFLIFKFHVFLGNMMESHTIPLHPIWDMNHLSVQWSRLCGQPTH